MCKQLTLPNKAIAGNSGTTDINTHCNITFLTILLISSSTILSWVTLGLVELVSDRVEDGVWATAAFGVRDGVHGEAGLDGRVFIVISSLIDICRSLTMMGSSENDNTGKFTH